MNGIVKIQQQKTKPLKPSIVDINMEGIDFMQAIKAVFDGVGFTPTQPIPVQGHYDVIITFIEPITPDENNPSGVKNSDMDFWREHKKLVADAQDEVLSLEDFPRK